MKRENFFNKSKQERIIHAVMQAERITSGEILPIIAKKSDFYYHAHLVIQVITSILLTVATLAGILSASFFKVEWTTQWGSTLPLLQISLFEFLLIPLLLILFFIFFGLFPLSIPFLTRLLIPKKQREKAVEEAAQQQFTKQKIHYTKESTGVLIYISLEERLIKIIADKGIDRSVSENFWQDRANEIAKAIKKGLGVTQLCNSIETIGLELQKNFPIHSDDQNELPNLIIKK